MKRLFVFCLVFVLLFSVISMGAFQYVDATTGMAFYGNRRDFSKVNYMVDAVKEGNTVYVASTTGVYRYVGNSLKNTYNLSSNYSVLRIYVQGEKNLWLVAKATISGEKYIYVYLLNKDNLRIVRYARYKFPVDEEPRRIDVEFAGKIISMSPLKTEINKVIVFMYYPTGDKTSVVLLESGTGGDTVAIKKKILFAGVYAIDSPALFSAYMYILYYSQTTHKMKIYRMSVNDLGVTYTGKNFSISDVKDADMEMQGDKKAFITVLRSSAVSFISLDMTTGNIRSTSNSGATDYYLSGMALRGDYVVSVYGNAGLTQITLWNDDEIYHLKSLSYSYTVRGRVRVDTAYDIPNGLLLPLGLQRFNSYIVQWHKGHVAVPDVSLKDESTYAQNAEGCYYVYTGRVVLQVKDTVLGTLGVINKLNGNSVITKFYLQGDGATRYMNVSMPSYGKNLLGFSNNITVNYYKFLGNSSTSWTGYSSNTICIFHAQVKAPSLSTHLANTTATKVELRVSTTIPSPHKIIIRVTGATNYTISVAMSQAGVKKIYIPLPKAGDYTIRALAQVKSGSSTVSSNYSSPVRVTRQLEVPDPTVSTATRTYLRSHVMKVTVAKTGTLEVKEGTSVYTFKVDAGTNNITIPIASRGTHIIKMRLCVSGVCSHWQSYNVELYDYIEMWIDRKDYMLNGISATMDTAPFIDPSVSRTVVPLRFILEGLSFDVKWNGTDRTITIIGEVASGKRTVIVSMPKADAQMRGKYKVYPGSTMVVVTDSSGTHVINMKDYKGQNMGVPFIYGSRTFVPVRFISEIFEAKVGWDGAERKVSIER